MSSYYRTGRNSFKTSLSLVLSTFFHGSALALIALGPALIPGLEDGLGKDNRSTVEFTISEEVSSDYPDVNSQVVDPVAKATVSVEEVVSTPKVVVQEAVVIPVKKAPAKKIVTKKAEPKIQEVVAAKSDVAPAPIIEATNDDSIIESENELQKAEQLAQEKALAEQKALEEKKQQESQAALDAQMLAEEHALEEERARIEAQAVQKALDEKLAQEKAQAEQKALAEQKAIEEKKQQEELAKAAEAKKAAELAAIEAAKAAEVAKAQSAQGSNGSAAAAGQGANSNGAITVTQNYLNLKQVPGNKPPYYTNEMRLQRLEGRGQLVYFVTKDGFVKEARLTKSTGSPDLDSKALTAIQNYKFFPGQEGYTIHDFEFSLKGPALDHGGRLRTTSVN